MQHDDCSHRWLGVRPWLHAVGKEVPFLISCGVHSTLVTGAEYEYPILGSAVTAETQAAFTNWRSSFNPHKIPHADRLHKVMIYARTPALQLRIRRRLLSLLSDFTLMQNNAHLPNLIPIQHAVDT